MNKTTDCDVHQSVHYHHHIPATLSSPSFFPVDSLSSSLFLPLPPSSSLFLSIPLFSFLPYPFYSFYNQFTSAKLKSHPFLTAFQPFTFPSLRLATNYFELKIF
ncbi:hypothetical protein IE53DRAFT_44311 [Violaceomyces palustris]|uniref:Uncharacterized protein n=1 Tax=Violaceomyces palustris TaxID=1673888 RepID=A0ACD0P7Y5_9BASI|nr:hypothetical protein IE53DRAFT_44311 [Violaceomyces palustris]